MKLVLELPGLVRWRLQARQMDILMRYQNPGLTTGYY